MRSAYQLPDHQLLHGGREGGREGWGEVISDNNDVRSCGMEGEEREREREGRGGSSWLVLTPGPDTPTELNGGVGGSSILSRPLQIAAVHGSLTRG